jgi:hypothetical protein
MVSWRYSLCPIQEVIPGLPHELVFLGCFRDGKADGCSERQRCGTHHEWVLPESLLELALGLSGHSAYPLLGLSRCIGYLLSCLADSISDRVACVVERLVSPGAILAVHSEPGDAQPGKRGGHWIASDHIEYVACPVASRASDLARCAANLACYLSNRIANLTRHVPYLCLGPRLPPRPLSPGRR